MLAMLRRGREAGKDDERWRAVTLPAAARRHAGRRGGHEADAPPRD